MANTITAANAVYSLTILGILQGPQVLQQYAADAAFDSTPINPVVVEMGIDAFMAQGYNPQPYAQGISLMANSISGAVFDAWATFMRTMKEAFPAQGVIILPSIQTKFLMINGALTDYQPVPNVARTLQPRKFTITWENFTAVPYSA